jgi:cytochrome d ubiquinol oxidase subunit II
VSAVGVAVLAADTPELYAELTTGRALPFLMIAVLSGLVSLALLWRRAYVAVRLTAAVAVTGLLWGWGLGQYPDLLPGVSVTDAAATDAVLAASLGALGVGALLLVPSLWWLYATFQHERNG